MNYYRKPGRMSRINPVIKCKPCQRSVSLYDVSEIPQEGLRLYSQLIPSYKQNCKAKSTQNIVKLARGPTKVYSFCGKYCGVRYSDPKYEANVNANTIDNQSSNRKLTVQNFEESSHNYCHRSKSTKRLRCDSKKFVNLQRNKSIQNVTSITDKVIQCMCTMVAEREISCDLFHDNVLVHKLDRATITKVNKPKCKQSITQTDSTDNFNKPSMSENKLDDMFGNYQRYLLSKLKQVSLSDKKPISMVELLAVLNEIMFDLRKTTNTFMGKSGVQTPRNTVKLPHSDHCNQKDERTVFAVKCSPSMFKAKSNQVINAVKICGAEKPIDKGGLKVNRPTSPIIRKKLTSDTANQCCDNTVITPRSKILPVIVKHSSQCCCIDCITK